MRTSRIIRVAVAATVGLVVTAGVAHADPPPDHSVTMVYNNGQPDWVQAVPDGGFADYLMDPVWPGHRFAGWHDNEDLTNLYDFNKPVTSSFKIYADWMPLWSVTVLAGPGGSASANVSEAVPIETVTLFIVENPGFMFKRWDVQSGGITIMGNEFEMQNEPVVVRALFEPIAATPSAGLPGVSVPGTTGTGSGAPPGTGITPTIEPRGTFVPTPEITPFGGAIPPTTAMAPGADSPITANPDESSDACDAITAPCRAGSRPNALLISGGGLLLVAALLYGAKRVWDAQRADGPDHTDME